jgi:predicted regulator of Ras-like GTPase activity (Roadblock/LC7/MglB family)
LKDVAGITGSFVFTSGGQLVAREIHAMFDDAALGDAAERLSRLSNTFASVGDELELAVIRFQDHKLYLKVLNGGMLCILADGVVNMAALRMAANLVGRRIATELEHAAAESSPQSGSKGAEEVRAGEAQRAGLDDSHRGSRLHGPLASTSVAPGSGDHDLPSSSPAWNPSGPPAAVTRQPAFAPGTRRFRGRSLE